MKFYSLLRTPMHARCMVEEFINNSLALFTFKLKLWITAGMKTPLSKIFSVHPHRCCSKLHLTVTRPEEESPPASCKGKRNNRTFSHWHVGHYGGSVLIFGSFKLKRADIHVEDLVTKLIRMQLLQLIQKSN